MNQLLIFACVLLGALAQRPVLPAQHTPILDHKFDLAPDGSYRFGYASADGSTREETSVPTNPGTEVEGRAVTGSYSYISPEGTPVSVNYVADEGGFRASGNVVNNAVSGVLPARVAPVPIAAAPIAPAVVAARQQLVAPYNGAYPTTYQGTYPYQRAGVYPGSYPGYVNPYNYQAGVVRPAYQGAYSAPIAAYNNIPGAYNNIPGAYNAFYNHPTANPYYRQF